MDSQALLDRKAIVVMGEGVRRQVFLCVALPYCAAGNVHESPHARVEASQGCQQLDGEGWEQVLLEKVLQGWSAKAHAGSMSTGHS